MILIFPPHWAFNMPHLAIPSLLGAMRAAKLDAQVLDLNLGFHDWLFSAEGVANLQHRIATRINQIDDSVRVSHHDLSQLKDCVVSLARSHRLRAEIESAAKVFRSDAFYEPKRLAWAFERLTRVYRLVGRAYKNTQMDFISCRTDHDISTPTGLAAAVVDRESNPYITYFEQDTLARLRALSPRIIGISICAETQWLACLTLCKMLRVAGYDGIIVLGGGVVTRLAPNLASEEGSLAEYCDLVALREGEETVVELASRSRMGRRIDDIPNTIVYTSSSGIIVNPYKKTNSYRAIPPPVFDSLPLSDYFSPTTVFPIMLARGCYHRCTFCDHSSAYGRKRSVRPIASMIKEMSDLQRRYGISDFAFSDEALSRSSTFKISSDILKSGLSVNLAASFRFDDGWTREQWNQTFQAGFRLAQFGLESGVPRVLDLMNKRISLHDAKEILRHASDAGLWNHIFLIFGFPGELREEANLTGQTVRENCRWIHSAGASRFHLMRQSEVARRASDFGVSPGAAGIWSLVLPYRTVEGISPEEADRAKADFDVQSMSFMRGSYLHTRLERAHLLLYLRKHGRERLLEMSECLHGSLRGIQTPRRFPIDIHLYRLAHDPTSSCLDERDGTPVALVADGTVNEIAVLNDAAAWLVKEWRHGSPPEEIALNFASHAACSPSAAQSESLSFFGELQLAMPHRNGGFWRKDGRDIVASIDELRKAIDAPSLLPNSALIEWFAVSQGRKPGMRITLYGYLPAHVEALLGRIRRHGLAVRATSARSDAFDHLAPEERHEAISASPVHVYIAKNERLVSLLERAEREGAKHFGMELGYPTCCISWLSMLDRQHGTTRPANFPIASAHGTNGRFYAELNNLLWFLPEISSPFYLLSHYPCSYNCRSSLESARSLYADLLRATPSFASDLRSLLSMPIVLWDETFLPEECWDENKGLCFDGKVVDNRILYTDYLSLRRKRDYSDLGVAFAEEIMVNGDRAVALLRDRVVGCWHTKEHGRAHILDFRWGIDVGSPTSKEAK